MKTIGLDKIIEEVIERLGKVEQVFLVGDFAKGMDSPIIDLVFVGDIDKSYLMTLVEKVEKVVKRKVRYLIFNEAEFEFANPYKLGNESLLLWAKD